MISVLENKSPAQSILICIFVNFIATIFELAWFYPDGHVSEIDIRTNIKKQERKLKWMK